MRSVVALAAVALACNGGTVPRYAPCTSTDTCPSATTCEPASASSAIIGPFCTWSCNEDNSTCPNDSNGSPGVCVYAIDQQTIEAQYSFCFQGCGPGITCPAGESCEEAQAVGSSTFSMVCVPEPADPLSGTSWQSTTIDPNATTAGVTSSAYNVTFGATNAAVGGSASGPFTAVLTLTYGPQAFMYAGCTETTTFTGGQWVDVPQSGPTAGALAISNAQGSTTRSGCASASDDVSGATGVYDGAVNDNQGAVYRISGATMTLAGGQGFTPYTDSAAWTFNETSP